MTRCLPLRGSVLISSHCGTLSFDIWLSYEGWKTSLIFSWCSRGHVENILRPSSIMTTKLKIWPRLFSQSVFYLVVMFYTSIKHSCLKKKSETRKRGKIKTNFFHDQNQSKLSQNMSSTFKMLDELANKKWLKRLGKQTSKQTKKTVSRKLQQ